MKFYTALIAILLLILLEITTLIFRWPKANAEVHSILHFGCGILLSIIPLLKVSYPKQSVISIPSQRIYYILLMGVALSIVWLFSSLPPLFQKIPIDPKTADMLPILQTMARRFLAGEEVYAFIDISEPMYPIYLPMLWLPFTLSEAQGGDPRYMVTLFLAVSVFFTIHLVPKKDRGLALHLLLLPFIWLIFWGIVYKEVTLLSMTQEGIIIAYYLFFFWAHFRTQNHFWIGIALACCLLSRYTLAFWFVMYFLYLYLTFRGKLAIRAAAVTLVATVVILFFSQAIFHLDIFLRLPQNYIQAIVQNRPKYEELIQFSLSVAKFFNYEDLAILHKGQFYTALSVPFFALLAYVKFKKYIQERLFVICCAKLSFVLFFNLLIMPYRYLFYTSVFVSLAILMLYLTPLVSDERQVNWKSPEIQ